MPINLNTCLICQYPVLANSAGIWPFSIEHGCGSKLNIKILFPNSDIGHVFPWWVVFPSSWLPKTCLTCCLFYQVSWFRPQFSDGKKKHIAGQNLPIKTTLKLCLQNPPHRNCGLQSVDSKTTPSCRCHQNVPWNENQRPRESFVQTPPKCCPQVISWFINFEPVKLWIHALYCIFYTQQKPTYLSSNINHPKKHGLNPHFLVNSQFFTVFGGTMWYPSQCLAPGCCRRHSRHRPRSRQNRHSVGQQRRRRSRRLSERPAAELWHCCLKRLGNTSNQQL